MAGPPLVIPFVLEVTFSGTYGSRPWANVQHFVWNESTAGRTPAALGAIGLGLTNAFSTNLLPQMNNHVLLTNTKVQDLDSLSGFTVDTPGAGPGTRSASGLPANVAVMATKSDAHHRRQRPGRSFFIGACEADTGSTDPNALDTTGLGDWQAAVGAYFNALDGTEAGSAYFPVVLHKSGTDLVPYEMTGMVVNAELATQRRRLRG